MDLSVVVPVFNEAENIEPLLGEISETLDGAYDYEVIYIDDGSTDDTFGRLRQQQCHYPRLRVLRHAAPCGQSTAILTGVKAARAGWIATLDGDGQNDPADIPRLLAELSKPERKLAMAVGYRRKRKDTGWRRLSSRLANAVRGGLLQDHTPDTGCGLKVFSREAFLALPYFDHMHRFLPALVQRAGGSVASLDVNHRPRLRGHSKYGTWNRLWVGIIDLLGVMWLQRRSKVPRVEELAASERRSVRV